MTSVDDLAAAEDPFEPDEEYDAFLADLYASRRPASREPRRRRHRRRLHAPARRAPDSLARHLAGHTIAITSSPTAS